MDYLRTCCYLIFTCLVWTTTLSSQCILQGRVVDEITEEPLPYASVYINSTTNGVTTDDKGQFEITVDSNFLELVVSFIGYESIVHKVDVGDIERRFLFMMSPRSELITEIEIKDKRGLNWYKNLAHFTGLFIGQSSLAKGAKIQNPEVLSFSQNDSSQIFAVVASAPIIITNKSLGYDIVYDLDHFSHDYNNNKVVFHGYSKFSDKEGGKRKQKKWKKNRIKAYRGSSMHFMKSVHEQRVIEEGFTINRIVEAPLPHIPSKEDLSAEQTMSDTVGFMSLPDTIMNILIEGAQKPGYVAYLNKNPHPYEDDVASSNARSILSFSDTWQVTYDREKEDSAYLLLKKYEEARKGRGAQVSKLTMIEESVQIFPVGLLNNPLAIDLKGYWAFEGIGDMLPYDYVLPEE